MTIESGLARVEPIGAASFVLLLRLRRVDLQLNAERLLPRCFALPLASPSPSLPPLLGVWPSWRRLGAPERTQSESGLGCPNGSTLPGRPIDRLCPLVHHRRFPNSSERPNGAPSRGTPMLSQSEGREESTTATTTTAKTIELPATSRGSILRSDPSLLGNTCKIMFKFS